ncbi:putative 3-methylcrotonyl-CoA carboxylase subunit alpha [Ascodesmis nigricans]|uniref:Putative 3-methylcrotonyl-CoA carboxylase subunit alpha n=1 Tax=Ascodesmis nigricans TaxID=341454 RepID=A0A4S2MQY3_9PEZI|nr:putative 3-methylcrotonyl-CoA carboxylase subunit alpha [Ascodesmis nigricans]
MFVRRPLRSQLLRPSQRLLYSTSAPQTIRPLKSILIANRGEIALRVSRTAAAHGIRTTSVFTAPDAGAAHVTASAFNYNLGPSNAYLDVEKVIKAAKESGCDSVHPGYGFLSENSHFAQRCKEEGLVFIGPPSFAMEAMGNKSESKTIMNNAGVPCVPGYHGSNQDPAFLLEQARKIKFPVLIKAVKGGGGKGMRIARTEQEFPELLESAKSEALSSFGDPTVLVERYITTPRHIEVQVFADNYGDCVALGERDCSVQRRHQKIIEESPAPHLDDATRKDIWKKARDAALAVGYQGAGTVEFIFDNDTGEFFFMEMNTRLQVEHPVTEMVTDVDLVHWQILIASGHPLPLTQDQVEARLHGHAFEARIYAENPEKGFIPDSGLLLHMKSPKLSEDVRVDYGFRAGDEITTFYDPMISKLIVRGTNREEALAKLRVALEEYEIAGPSTNIEFIKRLADHPSFINGDVETGFIEKHPELFDIASTPTDAYAQAALSILLSESEAPKSNDPFAMTGQGVGFAGGFSSRQIILSDITNPDKRVPVSIQQIGLKTYDIRVGETVLPNVSVTESSADKITGFYPHARVESTIVKEGQNIFVFQRGRKFQLHVPQPAWFDKVKGAEADVNTVIAPMPCKVLRVMVKEGQEVKKDEPLCVIESMKMETVIRSPHDGKVAKVVHAEGDVVKAGVSLVLFEDQGEQN